MNQSSKSSVQIGGSTCGEEFGERAVTVCIIPTVKHGGSVMRGFAPDGGQTESD